MTMEVLLLLFLGALLLALSISTVINLLDVALQALVKWFQRR